MISSFIISVENLYLITFAGTHHAIAYGGISFVTTAHAAITAHCQIWTHDIIFAQVQIRTSFQTTVSQFEKCDNSVKSHGVKSSLTQKEQIQKCLAWNLYGIICCKSNL